jgi:hypothetical protein
MVQEVRRTDSKKQRAEKATISNVCSCTSEILVEEYTMRDTSFPNDADKNSYLL